MSMKTRIAISLLSFILLSLTVSINAQPVKEHGTLSVSGTFLTNQQYTERSKFWLALLLAQVLHPGYGRLACQ